MSNESKALCIFNREEFAQQFTSFAVRTVEEKKALYNCINVPDNRLADMINKTIDLRDVVINTVVLTADKNPAPGSAWANMEDQDAFRVILIDKDGVTYAATSSGVYNSVKNIFNIFGTLHFEEPMKIEVKQVKTKNGNTLTLSLVD